MILALTLLLAAGEPEMTMTLHPGLEPRPVCRAPGAPRSLYLGRARGATPRMPFALEVRGLPEKAPDGSAWRPTAEAQVGVTMFEEPLDPAAAPVLPRATGGVTLKLGDDGAWRHDEPGLMLVRMPPGREPSIDDALRHTHAKKGVRHPAWHPAGRPWSAGLWAYVDLVDGKGETHRFLIKSKVAAPGYCADFGGEPSAEVPEPLEATP